MNDALITSLSGVSAGVVFMATMSLYLMKFKIFKALGPALICILAGLLLSNLHIMPFSSAVYSYISHEVIMLAIAIMLLNVNLKELLKLSIQPLCAMFLACASVCLVVFLASFIFIPLLSESWKLAGMMVATYTGGSSNLNAVAVALEASQELIAAANAADYAAYPFYIILIMYLASNLHRFKWFEKLWPYRLRQDELLLKGGHSFLKPKEWSIQDITWILSLGFIVVALSGFLAKFFPDSSQSAMKIIILTSLAIILAQFEKVKQLKGTMDIGLFLSLLFLVRIGLSIDMMEFLKSALLASIFFACVIFISFITHAILCRLFKIKYQYALIAIQSAIGSSSSSTVLAAVAGWESLISIAAVLGVLGGAVGNYLGIAMAYFIKTIF